MFTYSDICTVKESDMGKLMQLCLKYLVTMMIDSDTECTAIDMAKFVFNNTFLTKYVP